MSNLLKVYRCEKEATELGFRWRWGSRACCAGLCGSGLQWKLEATSPLSSLFLVIGGWVSFLSLSCEVGETVAWSPPHQCPVAGSFLLEPWGLLCGLRPVLFCSLMIQFKPATRSFVPNGHLSVSREKPPHLLEKIKLVLVVVLNKIPVPFVST